MSQDEADDDHARCPNCGAAVVYQGRGRRPVWCSTRCRNDAALKRRGARLGGVEVRLVEVPRRAVPARPGSPCDDPLSSAGQPGDRGRELAPPPPPTPAQALKRVQNDPELIGTLLSHLERLRQSGQLETDDWRTVRNALRIIGTNLTDDGPGRGTDAG